MIFVMIRQINNKSERCVETHESDIDFLRKFYSNHKHFPIFQQVLIETRTDCNNHCPFCPHAFNKKPLGIMVLIPGDSRPPIPVILGHPC